MSPDDADAPQSHVGTSSKPRGKENRSWHRKLDFLIAVPNAIEGLEDRRRNIAQVGTNSPKHVCACPVSDRQIGTEITLGQSLDVVNQLGLEFAVTALQ